MLRLNQEWIDPKTTSPKLVKEALLTAHKNLQTCYILFDDESTLSIEDLEHIYSAITHWAKRHGMPVYLVVESGFLYKLYKTFDTSVLSFLELNKLKLVWTLKEEDIKHTDLDTETKKGLISFSLKNRKILSLSIQIISISLIGVGMIMGSLSLLEKLSHETLINELQELHQNILDLGTNVSQDEEISLFDTMKSRNSDYIGWINIESTSMSFPIVKGFDNQYYLNTGFDKRPSSYGSIFMDYRNVNMDDAHLVIYGHSVRHTAMFGNLIKYEQKDFLNQHQFITIRDDQYEYRYKVFSFHRIDANKTRLSLPVSNSNLRSVMQNYASQSTHQDTNFEVTQLLTLVSCEYSYDNGRVFVHAYLESKQLLSNKE